MTYEVFLPQLHGESIDLPASKSISNRLLLLTALSGDSRRPDNLSDCDDTRAVVAALESDLSHVDVGAAGTAMRFLTAYLATKPGVHHITGSERMKQRPIGVLVDALRSLGAKIDYEEKEGCPPLRIEGGGLCGGRISIAGNVSSQFISALMMIAPTLDGGLQMELTGEVGSKPYIRMTQGCMRQFGVETTWDDKRNTISIPQQNYTYKQLSVEADWSAASYWYAIVAMRPGVEMMLRGLAEDSMQGDSAVKDIFGRLGVSTSFEADGCHIISSKERMQPFAHIDFADTPDIAQTVAVAMAMLGCKFEFTGLKSLIVKETDRLHAVQTELMKYGYPCEVAVSDTDATMRCSGKPIPYAGAGIPLKTYKDHRMAMAFAPLCMHKGIHSSLLVDDPMVVTKSYPSFWEDLRKVGFVVRERCLGTTNNKTI